MSHDERMREQLRGLEELLKAEQYKPSSTQNKDFIRDTEKQINGLKAQLSGGMDLSRFSGEGLIIIRPFFRIGRG
jgi:hypothetical protein